MNPEQTQVLAVTVFLAALVLTYLALLLGRSRSDTAKDSFNTAGVATIPDGQATAPDRAVAHDPLLLAREVAREYSGTVFLGLDEDTEGWVTAPGQDAVLVLGPPGSGKTSSVVVPSILIAPGPVVSTSTKTDVLAATAPARARLGRVWHFDPAADEATPAGVKQLRWSPLTSSSTWSGARLMAAAMVDASSDGKGAESASSSTGRTKALLAPLLYAAALSEQAAMRDVYTWVHEEDLGQPVKLLRNAAKSGDDAALLAAGSLLGVDRHSDRDVFVAAQSVLWPYGSPEALERSSRPNFDANTFVATQDTIYITAPANLQQLAAPLVVGLLHDIETAIRRRANLSAGDHPPALWALDETANIAPIKRLPDLVSAGGEGQGIQVLACLQDISQARARWGAAADGFLSVFTTKVVFGGIADAETLESLSVLVGDWEKPKSSWHVGESDQRTQHGNPLSLGGRSRGTSVGETYTTEKTRILTPGDIAAYPRGQALVITPAGFQTAVNATLGKGPTAEILRAAARSGPPLRLPLQAVQRPDGTLFDDTDRKVMDDVVRHHGL